MQVIYLENITDWSPNTYSDNTFVVIDKKESINESVIRVLDVAKNYHEVAQEAALNRIHFPIENGKLLLESLSNQSSKFFCYSTKGLLIVSNSTEYEPIIEEEIKPSIKDVIRHIKPREMMLMSKSSANAKLLKQFLKTNDYESILNITNEKDIRFDVLKAFHDKLIDEEELITLYDLQMSIDRFGHNIKAIHPSDALYLNGLVYALPFLSENEIRKNGFSQPYFQITLNEADRGEMLYGLTKRLLYYKNNTEMFSEKIKTLNAFTEINHLDGDMSNIISQIESLHKKLIEKRPDLNERYEADHLRYVLILVLPEIFQVFQQSGSIVINAFPETLLKQALLTKFGENNQIAFKPRFGHLSMRDIRILREDNYSHACQLAHPFINNPLYADSSRSSEKSMKDHDHYHRYLITSVPQATRNRLIYIASILERDSMTESFPYLVWSIIDLEINAFTSRGKNNIQDGIKAIASKCARSARLDELSTCLLFQQYETLLSYALASIEANENFLVDTCIHFQYSIKSRESIRLTNEGLWVDEMSLLDHQCEREKSTYKR